MRAADLPVGSVVAGKRRAWVKVDVEPSGTWHGSGSNEFEYDDWVQEYLDKGAQVLRVGDGGQP
ncbi:hypothetical protein [Actinoplanes rectilineatus]|uniref:hypothetical protein n=1 Tax=Actinoplanes rectilineatus TaxID=113571 RepID=UPI0005F28756|nr:hypothetical protein [Actinoplanes rectilineatus]